MHDNRRQLVRYFGQNANVLDIFALNTQPIRENQIRDWNSGNRIFAQVAIVNHLELALVRKVAIHRIGK